MKTDNFPPKHRVPTSGRYVCLMCQHGDTAIKNALVSLAKSKGLNEIETHLVLAKAGLWPEKPAAREHFNAGDGFGECPRHRDATGWRLEEKDEEAEEAAEIEEAQPEESQTEPASEVDSAPAEDDLHPDANQPWRNMGWPVLAAMALVCGLMTWFFFKRMDQPLAATVAVTALFYLSLAFLAIDNVRTLLIEDTILYPLWGIGLALTLMRGWPGFFWGMGGLALISAIGWLINAAYKQEAIGGGSLKLHMVISLFLGWPVMLSFWLGYVISLAVISSSYRKAGKKYVPDAAASAFSAILVYYFFTLGKGFS